MGALQGTSADPNVPGVLGENTADGGRGVVGNGFTAAGIGVLGQNGAGVAVYGNSGLGTGVVGESQQPNGSGVLGENRAEGGRGVVGNGFTAAGIGVLGQNGAGVGVYGNGIPGVRGVSTQPGGVGVDASGESSGVAAFGSNFGVLAGASTAGIGVQGTSQKFVAVYGFAGDPGQVGSDPKALTPWVAQVGVYGRGSPLVVGPPGTPIGVFGVSNANQGQGVSGLGTSDTQSSGVVGISTLSYGVHGSSDQSQPNGYAGYFAGKVHVTGLLEKAGGGFKIDHPLDPSNQYLVHSFVESSEMKNVYDGSVELNLKGEAIVTLPGWFEGLNKDYRYQLTAIGTPAPNLHVARMISKGRFKIAGGKPGMQVCWQVTGIRKDPWATAHPISVEKEKPKRERGYYLHPELHSQPAEKGIEWARHPAQAKLIKEMMKTRKLAPLVEQRDRWRLFRRESRDSPERSSHRETISSLDTTAARGTRGRSPHRAVGADQSGRVDGRRCPGRGGQKRICASNLKREMRSFVGFPHHLTFLAPKC